MELERERRRNRISRSKNTEVNSKDWKQQSLNRFLQSLSLSDSFVPQFSGDRGGRSVKHISRIGGKRHTNLAKVEGLRARPWLKPGSYANGDQYDYDGDEGDHSRPWWRRRLRSLYMAASSFTPSTFRIAISLLLLVAIGTAFIFLPVEQAIPLSHTIHSYSHFVSFRSF